MKTTVENSQVVMEHGAGLIKRHRRRVLTFSLLFGLLFAGILASVSIGQFHISVSEVYYGILDYFGWTSTEVDPMVTATLWNIRLPRVFLGILVGAALAVSGAIMQAIFANPLAEPGIIGVSSGAAVGAAITIVFAPYALAGFAVPVAAFVTGLLTSFLVYLLSLSAGKTEPLTLVLTGIAVTAVAGAVTSVATYLAPMVARDQIVFWQMGSLNGASWMQVKVVGLVVLVGLVLSLIIASRLDILALGDQAAGHIGINVQLLRTVAIVIVSLLTAAAVAYAGVIAFVGLIVPHVLRLAIGPVNKYLIPASLFGGALLLTISDLLARNLIAFADLPIGIFTALIGGPLFFVLLRSNLRGIRKVA